MGFLQKMFHDESKIIQGQFLKQADAICPEALLKPSTIVRCGDVNLLTVSIDRKLELPVSSRLAARHASAVRTVRRERVFFEHRDPRLLDSIPA